MDTHIISSFKRNNKILMFDCTTLYVLRMLIIWRDPIQQPWRMARTKLESKGKTCEKCASRITKVYQKLLFRIVFHYLPLESLAFLPIMTPNNVKKIENALAAKLKRCWMEWFEIWSKICRAQIKNYQ